MTSITDDAAALSGDLLGDVAAFVIEKLGLRCPKERWDDLTRGLAALSSAIDLPDAAAAARWVLTASPPRRELEILSRHLVTGESYFLREPASFAALRHRVLPDLVHARRTAGMKRLRLWSAACATGEEAFSLAMSVEMVIPDLATWNVEILATDINADHLDIAAKGIYRDWSFRGVPPSLRDRFFHPRADGRFELDARVRDRVTFAHLNLVSDPYPWHDDGGIDLILCRNVLMYFEPWCARGIVHRLAAALNDDGWLAVAAAECSRSMFEDFNAVRFPGTVLYRKQLKLAAGEAPAEVEAVAPRSMEPYEAAAPAPAPDVPADPASLAREARALADRGALEEASQCARRAVAANKLDATAHYLLASIDLERGDVAEATGALHRAVFLAPDFALAHYMLGVLACRAANPARARLHLGNALAILARLGADEELPSGDGLAVGELSAMARSMCDLAAAGDAP